MEWYMWIVTFTVGSFFANLLLKWLYGKKHYFHKEFVEQGYERGYRDGAANVKMYYSVKSKLPSTQWLKQNHGKTLNTRAKILSSLNSEN